MHKLNSIIQFHMNLIDSFYLNAVADKKNGKNDNST